MLKTVIFDNTFESFCAEPQNPCEEKPCHNDGECIFEDNRQDYRCKCKKTFSGNRCEGELVEQSFLLENNTVTARHSLIPHYARHGYGTLTTGLLEGQNGESSH